MRDAQGLNTPEARAKSSASRRANASIKHALMNAFDKLGNEAFFIELGRGSAEDRRCLAQIFAKLIPIEVAGALDASLTVRVIAHDGRREFELTNKRIPKEPVTIEAVPVPPHAHRAPEESPGDGHHDPERV